MKSQTRWLFVLTAAMATAADDFQIKLWTNGRIPYGFVDLTEDQQRQVRRQMYFWEAESKGYIDFHPCGDSCTGSYLRIRHNAGTEDGNWCGYSGGGTLGAMPGMNPNGYTTLRIGNDWTPNTLLHELGHCLGLWHEHNRDDADNWLFEIRARDGQEFADEYETRPESLMPLLGNYDYDSVMHYASWTSQLGTSGTLKYTDMLLNTFSRWQTSGPSAKDKSRVFQYYAREHQPNWGFFQSLSKRGSGDTMPDPYLAFGVWAVGTPAVAYQSSGNWDIVVRGSDNHLYHRAYRRDVPSAWTSIGCCAGSDPSAVSRTSGTMDVAVIGAESGKLIRISYANGNWGRWHYVRDGYPSGGIKPAMNGDGFIGPGIASRGAFSLDIFVVGADGVLAVTTLSGDNFGEWRTLGRDYVVTARPAATALSAAQVQLAINERSTNLYEPVVNFPPLELSFNLGSLKAVTALNSPPALTLRSDLANPYRVLITNTEGRISHRFKNGSWRDIGGIPTPGTGPSAVAEGAFGARIIMNGEDQTGCVTRCIANGLGGPAVIRAIQPGGLWVRKFE